MSSKTLCFWLKAGVIAIILCGLVVFGFILPGLGQSLAAANPEYTLWYWPWLIFVWAVALPLAIITLYVWKVAGAIGRDEAFTFKTAQWVKTSAFLLFGDVIFFMGGNIVFGFLGANHPGVLLLALFISLFALVMALLAAVLSQYIIRAASLQEENEGTV